MEQVYFKFDKKLSAATQQRGLPEQRKLSKESIKELLIKEKEKLLSLKQDLYKQVEKHESSDSNKDPKFINRKKFKDISIEEKKRSRPHYRDLNISNPDNLVSEDTLRLEKLEDAKYQGDYLRLPPHPQNVNRKRSGTTIYNNSVYKPDNRGQNPFIKIPKEKNQPEQALLAVPLNVPGAHRRHRSWNSQLDLIQSISGITLFNVSYFINACSRAR